RRQPAWVPLSGGPASTYYFPGAARCINFSSAREGVVSFYDEVVFPWLCDLVLGRPFVGRYRRELLEQVSGDVLELGFGTGLNLPHYPAHVRRITAIDPSRGMRRRARRRLARSRIQVELRLLGGERLPFADGSFDCVVSTWTLCSIRDVGRALAEAHRVL